MSSVGPVTYSPDGTTWSVTVTDLPSDGTPLTVSATSSDGETAGSVVAVQTQVALSGEADGAAAATGVTVPTFRVPGSAAGQAGAAASLAVQPPLRGGAAGQASASATLQQRTASALRLFSVAAGDGSSVTLGVPTAWNVTGGDNVPVGVGVYPSGYYGPGVTLSGTAGGHAGATATPGVVQWLAGTADGHAHGHGAIPFQAAAGEGDGHASAAGSLSQAQPLSGEADGHAGATATGPQTPIPLAGSADGQATAAATNPTDTPLSGRADGREATAAALAQEQALSARAEGHAAASTAFAGPPDAVEPLQAHRVVISLMARTVPGAVYARRLPISLRART